MMMNHFMVSLNDTIVLKTSSWMSWISLPREQKVIMTMMIVKKIKNGSRLVVKLKLKLTKLNTTFWKINNYWEELNNTWKIRNWHQKEEKILVKEKKIMVREKMLKEKCNKERDKIINNHNKEHTTIDQHKIKDQNKSLLRKFKTLRKKHNNNNQSLPMKRKRSKLKRSSHQWRNKNIRKKFNQQQ